MSFNALYTLKSTSPGQRFTKLIKRTSLLKVKRLKKECKRLLILSGRNHSGKITVRHRGGGHAHHYRKLDYSRSTALGINEGLEYDPNRKAWINRLFNPDKHTHKYILGVQNLSRGNILKNYSDAHLKSGHHHFLSKIPIGYVVHNVSQHERKGGQYLRAAGTYGQLLQKTNGYAQIKLRSGEHRLFSLKASASLGAVICENAKLIKFGKAGRRRWMGHRPKVRGVAINPVDHPHGGGEGKTSGGGPSVSPWGKPTKGKPTVSKQRQNPYIIRKKKN